MSNVIKSLYVETNHFQIFSPYRVCVSDRKIVGKHERVFSDHFDFVAPESFNGNLFCFQDCPNTYFLYRHCNRNRFSRGRSRTSLHPSSKFLLSLYSRTQGPQNPGNIVLFSQISYCLQPLSHSPNLVQKHVFVRPHTCLKTWTRQN